MTGDNLDKCADFINLMFLFCQASILCKTHCLCDMPFVVCFISFIIFTPCMSRFHIASNLFYNNNFSFAHCKSVKFIPALCFQTKDSVSSVKKTQQVTEDIIWGQNQSLRLCTDMTKLNTLI